MFRRRLDKLHPNRATYRDIVFERDGDLIAFGDTAIQGALAHNVSPAVHFDDLIFASLYMTVAGKDVDRTAQTYFTNGRITAERIKNIATHTCCVAFDEGTRYAPTARRML
jgi:hypothetical protein